MGQVISWGVRKVTVSVGKKEGSQSSIEHKDEEARERERYPQRWGFLKKSIRNHNSGKRLKSSEASPKNPFRIPLPFLLLSGQTPYSPRPSNSRVTCPVNAFSPARHFHSHLDLVLTRNPNHLQAPISSSSMRRSKFSGYSISLRSSHQTQNLSHGRERRLERREIDSFQQPAACRRQKPPTWHAELNLTIIKNSKYRISKTRTSGEELTGLSQTVGPNAHRDPLPKPISRGRTNPPTPSRLSLKYFSLLQNLLRHV